MNLTTELLTTTVQSQPSKSNTSSENLQQSLCVSPVLIDPVPATCKAVVEEKILPPPGSRSEAEDKEELSETFKARLFDSSDDDLEADEEADESSKTKQPLTSQTLETKQQIDVQTSEIEQPNIDQTPEAKQPIVAPTSKTEQPIADPTSNTKPSNRESTTETEQLIAGSKSSTPISNVSERKSKLLNHDSDY